MTVPIESTERFLRPTDVDRVRRNYRSIQMQQLLAILRNAAIAFAAAAAGLILFQRTQSDARFAVHHVQIVGAQRTARADLERVTRRYAGLNLFNLDIARLRRELTALPWVSRIEIEKKLPDTLRVRVVERTPVALAEDGGRIAYVDERGALFAELTPSIGDPDLPLIGGARGAEVARCLAILRQLRTQDPELYACISEVRPLPQRGFAFFDRQLQTFVYANEEDLSTRWRDLHAIARAERFGRSEIAYADLRFSGRVVVKLLRTKPAPAIALRTVVPAEITN